MMMMKLEEVRAKIDAIDPQLRKLIMERLDCSRQVAEIKFANGETTIYRADREKAILERLGQGVPADRVTEYLAAVKKIMETSRMYQYGLLYDWDPTLFDPLAEGIDITPGGYRVRVRMTLPDQPNAMSSILSMIGDYGFNMQYLEVLSFNFDQKTVTFELTIFGDLSKTPMKKLMFQLSKESQDFRIVANDRERKRAVKS